jgi:hypothetical protein
MRLLLPLALAVVFATLGVASDGRSPAAAALPLRAHADTVGEYRGLYETGFEVSWFHACGAPPGDDSWWVTLSNDALRQRDSLARGVEGQPRTLYVRWRGTVSPKMPAGAGHMGRGSRYMLVTEVLQLRASDASGCTST